MNSANRALFQVDIVFPLYPFCLAGAARCPLKGLNIENVVPFGDLNQCPSLHRSQAIILVGRCVRTLVPSHLHASALLLPCVRGSPIVTCRAAAPPRRRTATLRTRTRRERGELWRPSRPVGSGQSKVFQSPKTRAIGSMDVYGHSNTCKRHLSKTYKLARKVQCFVISDPGFRQLTCHF